MVSGLTYRSLIHSEFILLCGMRRVLVSLFSTELSSFSSNRGRGAGEGPGWLGGRGRVRPADAP